MWMNILFFVAEIRYGGERISAYQVRSLMKRLGL